MMRATKKPSAAGEKPDVGKTVPKSDSAKPGVPPFWKKPLEKLSKTEWEALCDGCGRCCLVKLEEEDTGTIHYTDIACKLFDAGTCRCADYTNRKQAVPDCVSLTRAKIPKLKWLPPTCAYKLRFEGRDLEWWHYLVSGSRNTVHTAGISARGRVGLLEDEIEEDDYPSRIVKWPGNAPRGKGRKG